MSARPSWREPSPRRPGPGSSGCSATRGSTSPRRSTSGTTRSSSCGSRRTRVANAGRSSRTDIFSEAFLLPRPLLAAIRADEPVVLLIDEIDRVEVEAEALMLEVLSRLPGDDPRARHDAGDAPADGRSSPRTTRATCPRRSSAAASTCTSTIPTSSASGRSCWPASGPDARPRRPRSARVVALDPRARPQEAAVDLGVARLGPHARRSWASRASGPRTSARRSTSCSSTRPTSSAPAPARRVCPSRATSRRRTSTRSGARGDGRGESARTACARRCRGSCSRSTASRRTWS